MWITRFYLLLGLVYRRIVRWKLVRDQHGKMVLFYREQRTPMPVPVIYVVQYDDIFCRIYPKTSPHWIGLKNSIRTTHVSILIPKAQLDKAPNIGVLLFFYLL